MSPGGGPSAREPDLAVNDARERMLAEAVPLEPEEIPLDDALGRVTAEPVTARADFPGFDNSAMDGFAVRAGDLCDASPTEPVDLTVEGESRAGSPWPGILGPGQAIGISTGAMVPEGADAILRVEDVGVSAGGIAARQELPAGHDIRRRAEAARSGELLIERGTRLGPVELGMLAIAGYDHVSCYRRPRVALLTSGDELVEPGTLLGPGQIWNSNSRVISALTQGAGGDVVRTESVSDRRNSTAEALKRAFDSDIVIVCGGVSVGEHDHVRPALAALGVEQRFWGLALKPGRPVWYGTRGETRVLGLPGNPVSTLVAFQLLADPMIRALGGEREGTVRPTGRLAEPIERLPARLQAVPCAVTVDHPDGNLLPLPQLGSYDFLSLRSARWFALIPPGTGRVEAGEVVETMPLGANRMV